MDQWGNLLDKNVLGFNVNFAAMFVLNYECLKDYVVNQVRDFYTDSWHFEEGEIVTSESTNYKKEVRSLDNNIENASLKWFINAEAITQEDYEMYQKIRKRRNNITHELLKNLNAGFNENDAKLFQSLLGIYNKIDKWWINEIEIPTSSEEIPEDYDRNEVCGGEAIILSIINDIILGDNGDRYKELLKILNQKFDKMQEKL